MRKTQSHDKSTRSWRTIGGVSDPDQRPGSSPSWSDQKGRFIVLPKSIREESSEQQFLLQRSLVCLDLQDCAPWSLAGLREARCASFHDVAPTGRVYSDRLGPSMLT